jgi:hypothetical protein
MDPYSPYNSEEGMDFEAALLHRISRQFFGVSVGDLDSLL